MGCCSSDQNNDRLIDNQNIYPQETPSPTQSLQSDRITLDRSFGMHSKYHIQIDTSITERREMLIVGGSNQETKGRIVIPTMIVQSLEIEFHDVVVQVHAKGTTKMNWHFKKEGEEFACLFLKNEDDDCMSAVITRGKLPALSLSLTGDFGERFIEVMQQDTLVAESVLNDTDVSVQLRTTMDALKKTVVIVSALLAFMSAEALL
eukprot:TRINITY_DN563_c0_g1_i12.p1 TRINITY_DN563_c0_g1~~TRINITY_DN563_c0_g1_i12.p1  ORF type:complete len:205 (+),score=30.86 TRINITY_DN563_c0_g1_i12:514-1128(+)